MKKLAAFVLSLLLTPNALATTCEILDGAYVEADDGTYLGFFGAASALESIANPAGIYGSTAGVSSVFNSAGLYGSTAGVNSANNNVAVNPPRIYSGLTFVGYLSTNATKTPRVEAQVVVEDCSFTSTAADRISGEGFFPLGLNATMPLTFFGDAKIGLQIDLEVEGFLKLKIISPTGTRYEIYDSDSSLLANIECGVVSDCEEAQSTFDTDGKEVTIGWDKSDPSSVYLVGSKTSDYISGSGSVTSTWIPSSSSEPDTTPPVFSSIEITPSEIDLSDGSGEVEVVVTASDEGSGISLASMRVVTPTSGTQSFFLTDQQDGTFTASITLDQFAVEGTWSINLVRIVDAEGNQLDVTESDFEEQGLQASFFVTNPNSDSKAPEVISISIDPTELTLTTGDEQVQISVEATDDLSGIDSASIRLIDPSGNYESYLLAEVSEGIFVAAIAFSDPAFGTWAIDLIRLNDKAGNESDLIQADLESLGLEIAFLILEDQDGDGVPDRDDAFPLDESESVDTDADGVGDNADVCPKTSDKDQIDSDSDGYGDACDPYPNDPEFWSMKIEDALDLILDNNLRECVRDPEGVDGWVTGRDGGSDRGNQTALIEQIQCRPPITTLSGLENFKELRALYIDNLTLDPVLKVVVTKPLSSYQRSSFFDLEPLSGLSRLEYLSIPHAEIRDLQPIAGLNNLKTLNLNLEEATGSKLSSLTPLEGLTKLESLTLANHEIDSLVSLVELRNLHTLNVSGNQLVDLAGLPNVGSYFQFILDHNPLKDFSRIVEINARGTYLVISVDSPEAEQFIRSAGNDLEFEYGGGLVISNSGESPESFDFLQDWSIGLFGCWNCGLNNAGLLEKLVDKVSSHSETGFLSLVDNEILDLRPLSQLLLKPWGGLPTGIVDIRENRVSDLSPLQYSSLTILINQENFLCSHLAQIRADSSLSVQEQSVGKSCLNDLDDQDGDGVLNVDDAFPTISSEWEDFDGDYLGDNGDPDDDNDGVDDTSDNFPLDSSETTDTDGDGIGNNADLDDDGDGFTDQEELADGTNPLSRFSCRSGCFSFDIDENNQAKALTDGLLVIRHLFGFTGDALATGAISTDATRDRAEDISALLADADSELDIDGNGESKALSDGLLLIRYLFGFTGDALIAGAIGAGATRDTSEAIEEYIKDRVPTSE